MDTLAAIRRLYLETTARTVARDLAQAIELLKSMSSEEERERAVVYMEGLAQMRSEWAARRTRRTTRARRKKPRR